MVVKFDTIEWANHLDIDPEVLYEKSLKMEEKLKSLHGTQESLAPVSSVVGRIS